MSALRPSTVLWVAVIALLGAAIGWQMNRDVVVAGSAAGAAGAAAALPSLPQLASGLPPAAVFSDIVDRPLFVETRRPPAAEQVASQGEPPPQWNLVGTAITAADRAALLFDSRNRKFLVMRAGASQAGWELADISPEGVVLEKGEAKHEIKLPRF